MKPLIEMDKRREAATPGLWRPGRQLLQDSERMSKALWLYYEKYPQLRKEVRAILEGKHE